MLVTPLPLQQRYGSFILPRALLSNQQDAEIKVLKQAVVEKDTLVEQLESEGNALRVELDTLKTRVREYWAREQI